MSSDLEGSNGRTEKVAEALPSIVPIPGVATSKPLLEDFVFFANAQRAAERQLDGTM